MSALFRAARTVDFDGLYRRHAATVYRYAFAVLGNHADAEDVTQQTFLNAYRAIGQGTRPRKEQNWLLRIAHNEVRRHFRRTRGKPMEVELDERLPHNGHEEERSEPTVADVLRALQHLPPLQRSALVMREFEGRPYSEIAELLNITPSALEGQLFRARRALAEHLEGALTCTDAEEAVLRRLDERLPRRVSRRLKAHLEECHSCVRFANAQKRQRALLKGLSVMPVPASLYLFRPEHAAAAGVGTTAAASGAGVGATGLAGGLFAKAAAVTASAAVAGGVGYTVATQPPPTADTDQKAAKAAVVRKAPRAVKPAPIAARPHDVARPERARTRGADFTPTRKKAKDRATAPATPPEISVATAAPPENPRRGRGRHMVEPRSVGPTASSSKEPKPRKPARPMSGKKNEHVERPEPARGPRPHPERPPEKAKVPPPPPPLPPLPALPALPEPAAPPEPPRGPKK
jgi:RNA polymerase sigma factor (sigma-70 family)